MSARPSNSANLPLQAEPAPGRRGQHLHDGTAEQRAQRSAAAQPLNTTADTRTDELPAVRHRVADMCRRAVSSTEEEPVIHERHEMESDGTATGALMDVVAAGLGGLQ